MAENEKDGYFFLAFSFAFVVSRRIQCSVQRESGIAIETHCRVEDPLQIPKCHSTLQGKGTLLFPCPSHIFPRSNNLVYLGFLVDKKGQSFSVEVKKDPDCRTSVDSTIRPLAVTVPMKEPGSSGIDVHSPALILFTCIQHGPIFLTMKAWKKKIRVKKGRRSYDKFS